MIRPIPLVLAAHLLLLLGRAQPDGPAALGKPLSFNLGRLVFRPSGFFENIAEYRSLTTPDTVYTRFGAIPLGKSPGQWLDSLRHSRISLHVDTRLGSGTLAGYIEIDFQNPPGQQPCQFRQYWGEFSQGRWRILAGQAWSLLRPNRAGTSSETDLMNTQAVDPAYHVGLMGLRKRQVRITRLMGAWQAVLAYEYMKGGDVLLKVARDTARAHFETVAMAGHARRLGFSLAAVVHAGARLDFVSQQFWSQGVGYDALKTLPPGVHAHATIQGAEIKVRKGLGLFSYGGIVYGTRSQGNRVVREWSVGARQQLLKAVFLSAQYSQLDRSLWNGSTGAMNFLMLSFRYVVPSAR